MAICNRCSGSSPSADEDTPTSGLCSSNHLVGTRCLCSGAFVLAGDSRLSWRRVLFARSVHYNLCTSLYALLMIDSTGCCSTGALQCILPTPRNPWRFLVHGN